MHTRMHYIASPDIAWYYITLRICACANWIIYIHIRIHTIHTSMHTLQTLHTHVLTIHSLQVRTFLHTYTHAIHTLHMHVSMYIPAHLLQMYIAQTHTCIHACITCRCIRKHAYKYFAHMQISYCIAEYPVLLHDIALHLHYMTYMPTYLRALHTLHD